MFARRPRYDDTFGVRMDLGADRKDPLSTRPSGRAGQLRVKPPVLVETPRSIGNIFGAPKDETLQPPRRTSLPLSNAPATAAPALTRSRDAAPEAAEGLRAFEDKVRALWNRIPVQQRVGAGLFGAVFLFSSGFLFPAIAAAIGYFVLRRYLLGR